MNAHELARALLAGPDLPVVIWTGDGDYFLQAVTHLESTVKPVGNDFWFEQSGEYIDAPALELKP